MSVSLTVMTFNLHDDQPQDSPNSWEKRRDICISVITSYSPIILCTQQGFLLLLLLLMSLSACSSKVSVFLCGSLFSSGFAKNGCFADFFCHLGFNGWSFWIPLQALNVQLFGQ